MQKVEDYDVKMSVYLYRFLNNLFNDINDSETAKDILIDPHFLKHIHLLLMKCRGRKYFAGY